MLHNSERPYHPDVLVVTGLLVLCVLVLLPCVAGAAEKESFGDFVSRRIDLINRGDRAAYIETFHPGLQDSIHGVHRDHFQAVVDATFATKIPADYTVKEVMISEDAGLPFEYKLMYPVRPTHGAILEHATGPGTSTTRIWLGVEKDGRWYWVVGVPRPDQEEPKLP